MAISLSSSMACTFVLCLYILLSYHAPFIFFSAAASPSDLIPERDTPNQPSPSPSSALAAGPGGSKSSELDAVEGDSCEEPSAPYGPFDIKNCGQARQDLHDDPAWPDKRKEWVSESLFAKSYGSAHSRCRVQLGAKEVGLVGTFTLADVEAGLITLARKCLLEGKGGSEYYTSVNRWSGKPIHDYKDGWAMRFHSPRVWGTLDESKVPSGRNISIEELEE